MKITRRSLIAAAGAVSLSSVVKAEMPAHPEFPRLRAGTEMDKIFEELLKSGKGLKKEGIKEGLPNVVIVYDTQCPWCSKLWNASKPLTDQYDFRWFPVAVLRDLSISQGAAILASDNPWQMMQTHEDHFKDEKVRGLDTSEMQIDKKYRDDIWTNSKIFRKAGGTVVPLGVYKTPSGKYIPILSGTDTEELTKILSTK